MNHSHVTGRCAHDEKEWCVHCEEGCPVCGSLENSSETEEGYCDDCAMERAVMRAEQIYEGDR